MRWKAFYLLIGLLIFLGLIGYFCLDLILKESIIWALETAIGTKVELRKLHLDIPNLALKIDNLQVTNPNNTWRNLIEFRDLRFKLALTPLYSGRIVIDEIAIEDLMLDTPRKTNGKLNRFILPGPLGEAQTKLNHDIASIPALDLKKIQNPINVDKLTASYHYKTTFSANTVKDKIEASNHKWKDNINKLEETKAKLKGLQQNIEAIKTSKSENLLAIRNKLKSLKEIQKSFAAVETQIGTTNQGFSTEFSALASDINYLQETAAADYDALLKLAKLPSFDEVNIAEALFGKALLNESTMFINLSDKIQSSIPVKLNNPPKEEHPRGGQDITFPGRQTFPRFLVKHIYVSGRGTPKTNTAGFYARGTVDGITSEPQLYGLPMSVTVFGQTSNQSFLNVKGELNHLSSNYIDQIQFQIGKIPVPEFKLPESLYLPTKITSGNADVKADFLLKPEYFRLNFTFTGHNLVGLYAQKAAPNDLMTQIVRDTLSKIDLLTINYQLETINKKLQIKVSSNIDQIISSKINALIGAEIAKTTQAIRQAVDTELKARQQELELNRAKYQQELTAQISQFQTLLTQQKQALAAKQKELEAGLGKTNIQQQLQELIKK